MDMKNVFQKLLLKDFGETNYRAYVGSFEKMILEGRFTKGKFENREIFEDIYKKLHKLNGTELKARLDRLLETKYASVQIAKNFLFNFLFYLLAMLLVVSMDLAFEAALFACGAMSLVFLYKMVQFFANKTCVVDALITEIYQSVLDVLLLSEKARKMQ